MRSGNRSGGILVPIILIDRGLGAQSLAFHGFPAKSKVNDVEVCIRHGGVLAFRPDQTIIDGEGVVVAC